LPARRRRRLHAVRGGWHVDVVDAERCERIEDGVDCGLRRGDAAGLAGALDAGGFAAVGSSARVISNSGRSAARVSPATLYRYSPAARAANTPGI